MTAGKFRDLDELLVVEPIELPIGGKAYQFPGDVSGRTGLLLSRLVNGALGGFAAGGDDQAATQGAVDALNSLDVQLLDDGEEHDLRAEILGDAEAEMYADGVTAAKVRHVWITLLVWHALGEDAALACWQGPGKAEAPNRAARRAVKKTTGRSTAAATTTKRRASTSGTTSPKKSKPKPKAGR